MSSSKKKKRKRPDPARTKQSRVKTEPAQSTHQTSNNARTKWYWIAAGLLVIAIFVLIRSVDWAELIVGPPVDPDSNGGLTANNAPKFSSPKEEFLYVADRISNSNDPHLGTLQVEQLRRQLDNSQVSSRQAGAVHMQLSKELLRMGDTSGAIDQIEAAFSIAKTLPNFQPVHWLALHQPRALVYLRKAEVANCIQRHNCDCCIFPLSGGGVHTDKTPANEAKKSLLAFLEIDPASMPARWLLNVACMALGEYPDGVPNEFRIPPEAFESDYDVGRFVDVAPQMNLDTFNLCGGVIVEDFDGDQMLDIVTSTYDPRGPLHQFVNLGTGSFDDTTASSQLDEQLGGLNLVAADYDNDGDTDILVLRGAWLRDQGLIRNSLLRNNGDRTFSDVTRSAGLAEPAFPTQAAAWGDFDGDGDLDLFIGNESRVEIDNGAGDYPSQLFQNNGDGTFTDIAESAGVTNDRYCKSATAGDFDNDGDLDLYLSNVGKNRLYRNNGDGTFTDVAEQLGVVSPDGRSFAAWFFDYNNDGWLDLFVAAYEAGIGDIAADYLGQAHEGVSPCLYLNDGYGGFKDIADQAGIDHPYLPMGANFGDLDNDGWLDVYLGTGDPDYQTLTPNIMLRNDRGQRFQDVTTSGGFGHLQKGHGVAFADIDNDGDQDIYHQLGGFYPGDKFHNALFKNPGHGNRFLYISLIGTKTNRAGYGARIRVTVNSPDGPRTVHRSVGSVSSFGGSPARQEIGLGNATKITSVDIDWPISGQRQVLNDVPLDSMIKVIEETDGFEQIELKSFDLP